MADETTTDKPLAPLVAAEKKIDPPAPVPAPAPLDPPKDPAPEAAEPKTAIDRLRAFEDAYFGKNAVRINGRVERGSGSLYQKAEPSVRERHGKLEKLIEAEEKLAVAHGALMQADTEHEQAQKAVEDAEKAADAAPAE